MARLIIRIPKDGNLLNLHFDLVRSEDAQRFLESQAGADLFMVIERVLRPEERTDEEWSAIKAFENLYGRQMPGPIEMLVGQASRQGFLAGMEYAKNLHASGIGPDVPTD